MITKVKIQNFKAIGEMVEIPIEPFTTFIGNNGSGKSTVMEALQVLQACVIDNLDVAFQQWGGMEKIRNYGAKLSEPEVTETGFKKYFEPIILGFTFNGPDGVIDYECHFNQSSNSDYYVVEYEYLRFHFMQDTWMESHIIGNTGFRTLEFTFAGLPDDNPMKLPDDVTTFKAGTLFRLATKLPTEIGTFILNWGFMNLNPHEMGKPMIQSRVQKKPRLLTDGSNISEYLLWLRGKEQRYLDQLIDLLRFVLPHVSDIQPSVTQGFNRQVELALVESLDNAQPLPGWVMSGGTLRIMAILSMFITPRKVSVLFIDEIENGLDPRTIGLILSLIQQEYHSKGMQVIVTSHSPYFLDLCQLENIVVCEKDETGCHFSIPDDDAKLKVWKEKFSPGQLYTMGKLTK